MREYLGIDLGGTKIAAILADDEGRAIASRVAETRAWEGEEAVFGRIAETALLLLEEAGRKPRDILAIGIGAPGPLDPAAGTILVTENLPFIDFPIAPRLESLLGIPAFLDNDANVAAMGEYLYSAGRGADPLVYLTVSTGIGAGAVIGGKIFRGRSSNALEAGHMTVIPDGPECKCGNRGCAEALASGTAIAGAAARARAAALDGSGPPTSLCAFEKPGAVEVFREAERGDTVAESIVASALGYLGICVANLVTLFDPDVLVIGGGIASSGERLFRTVRETVHRRCFKVTADRCRILPAGLGENSGTLGAVALAVMESRRRESNRQQGVEKVNSDFFNTTLNIAIS